MKNLEYNRTNIEYNGKSYIKGNGLHPVGNLKKNHEVVKINDREYVINHANGFIYEATK